MGGGEERFLGSVSVGERKTRERMIRRGLHDRYLFKRWTIRLNQRWFLIFDCFFYLTNGNFVWFELTA